MKLPSDLSMLPRTSTQQHRLEQMSECVEIKNRLAKDNINVDIKTLERACVIPSDVEIKPLDRELAVEIDRYGDGKHKKLYPYAAVGLMENLNKKKKKKKKGKKRK